MDNDKRKQQYLKNFERQNPVSDLFSPNAQRIGNNIAEKLKKRRADIRWGARESSICL